MIYKSLFAFKKKFFPRKTDYEELCKSCVSGNRSNDIYVKYYCSYNDVERELGWCKGRYYLEYKRRLIP